MLALLFPLQWIVVEILGVVVVVVVVIVVVVVVVVVVTTKKSSSFDSVHNHCRCFTRTKLLPYFGMLRSILTLNRSN